MNFQVQQIPRVRQLHKIGEVGKWNYISMTYSLSNNCTKNYYNRTLTVQVIVEDVVTWIFLKHSVEACSDRKPRQGSWTHKILIIAPYYCKNFCKSTMNRIITKNLTSWCLSYILPLQKKIIHKHIFCQRCCITSYTYRVPDCTNLLQALCCFWSGQLFNLVKHSRLKLWYLPNLTESCETVIIFNLVVKKVAWFQWWVKLTKKLLTKSLFFFS